MILKAFFPSSKINPTVIMEMIINTIINPYTPFSRPLIANGYIIKISKSNRRYTRATKKNWTSKCARFCPRYAENPHSNGDSFAVLGSRGANKKFNTKNRIAKIATNKKINVRLLIVWYIRDIALQGYHAYP